MGQPRTPGLLSSLGHCDLMIFVRMDRTVNYADSAHLLHYFSVHPRDGSMHCRA